MFRVIVSDGDKVVQPLVDPEKLHDSLEMILKINREIVKMNAVISSCLCSFEHVSESGEKTENNTQQKENVS